MKIAILDRIDSYCNPGGDTVQIRAIADFLIKHGFQINILPELTPDLSEYDMAIIFNLTRYHEVLLQSITCIKHNISYILFPVYWDLDDIKIPFYGIKSFIKSNIPKDFVTFSKNMKFVLARFKWAREIIFSENLSGLVFSKTKILEFVISKAKIICPNSYAELNHILQNVTNADKSKFYVIFNGIQKDIYIKGKYKRQGNLSCIGGIGPRKNQLNLLKALEKTTIKTELIGNHSKDSEYTKELKKYSFVKKDWMPHDRVLEYLSSVYAHIQPSFIETPGLVSMEAFALGCKTIVSDVGPVREYFKEFAYYVDPYSIDSIRNKVEEVFNSKETIDIEICRAFNEQYSWDNVLKPLISLF